MTPPSVHPARLPPEPNYGSACASVSPPRWIRRKKAASARFPLPVRTETLPGRRPCRPKTLGANRLHPHGGRTSRPLLSRLGRCRLKRFGNIQVRLRTPQRRRIRGAFQGCGTVDLPSSRPCCSGIAMGSTRRTWSASTRRGWRTALPCPDSILPSSAWARWRSPGLWGSSRRGCSCAFRPTASSGS